MGEVVKMVYCWNCKYKYDCERTYLGGCTDGEEFSDNEMENEKDER